MCQMSRHTQSNTKRNKNIKTGYAQHTYLAVQTGSVPKQQVHNSVPSPLCYSRFNAVTTFLLFSMSHTGVTLHAMLLRIAQYSWSLCVGEWHASLSKNVRIDIQHTVERTVVYSIYFFFCINMRTWECVHVICPGWTQKCVQKKINTK